MLAERLLEFARILADDFEETGTLDKLRALNSGLQNQASNVNEPSFQATVAQSREVLEKALAASKTNSLSPYWGRMLDECKVRQYFGSGLLDRVNSALSRNALTPAEAAKSIRDLTAKVEAAQQFVGNLIDSLEWFEIDIKEPGPGEFEIDITIPRAAINNEVGELGSEFQKIDRILGFFEEMTTGSRGGARLVGLSTTDPSIFISALPATAAAFTLAIERAVALYGKILEIRKMHAELKNQGLSDKALKGVTDHIETAVKAGLADHAKDLEKTYFKQIEAGRAAELRNELAYVLGQLVERVDDGYRFDVRGQPADPEAPNAQAVEEALEVIQKHRQSLISFTPVGEPILKLSDRRPIAKAAVE